MRRKIPDGAHPVHDDRGVVRGYVHERDLERVALHPNLPWAAYSNSGRSLGAFAARHEAEGECIRYRGWRP